MKELEWALSSAYDTSPGPDDIPYAFLRHLNEEGKVWLLGLFNLSWEASVYPGRWRDAITIPIPKPGKDRKSASSYRPIALTSCVSKTIERMVNARLIWVAETCGRLTDLQCGFRRRTSTVDLLVNLEGHLETAFAKKQHSLGIFFDLEKAYDTTWWFLMLRSFREWGLRGYLPTFVSAFMQNRRFAVRREEVVLARARIGHCYLTHGFLLRREDPPVCRCGEPLSVRHIFCMCPTLRRVRRRELRSDVLRNILRDYSEACTRALRFLRRANYFDRF